jgi:hypothetical protein
MYRLHHLQTSFGIALALLLLTSLLRAQPGTQIPSPATWVPFAADLVGQDSTTHWTGRYFRSSEGSTRMEVTPSQMPAVTSVTISNIPRLTQYWCRSDTTVWRSSPLDALHTPPGPPKMNATLPGLRKLDTNLRRI